MNELIEKLKKNEKPFGLLTLEEQECLRKIGIKNCLYYSSGIPNWQIPAGFANGQTYRIKPDYKPEPEYVDLEIILHNAPVYHQARVVKMLCVRIDENTMYQLHELPSLPGFRGFWFGAEWVSYDRVAIKRDEGKTVYARFRT